MSGWLRWLHHMREKGKEHFYGDFKELVFFAIVSFTISVLLTVTDIVVFDTYVLPIIAECKPGNASEFCMFWRNYLEVPLEADENSFGIKYWQILAAHFWILGILMGAIRTIAGWVFGKRNETPPNQPHRIWLVLTFGVAWGWGTSAWFLFGWLDAGYYYLRGFDIPLVLDWLDGIGFFPLTQWIGGFHVEIFDLFLLMIIGAVIVAFTFIGAFVIKHIFYEEEEIARL